MFIRKPVQLTKIFLFNLVIASLFTIGLANILSASVSATSPYDNVYKTTDELILKTNNGACADLGSIDIASSWEAILANKDY